ncbi:XdhC family protein [Kribbella sp. NPDC026596]|uniref:XdhC family protein n=1 Tax=Kribbella sp. NPDC026596 TaxID=3155122 RepID=UPI0033FCD903
MRDLLDDIDRWRADGRAVVLARVVDLEGSGPRGPGAAMAVNDRLEVTGSVSGGCIEGALVTAAEEVFTTGERSVHTFGYSDSEAFAVGLTCGGTIHVYVEPLDW